MPVKYNLITYYKQHLLSHFKYKTEYATEILY